jgi:hypothetical protein
MNNIDKKQSSVDTNSLERFYLLPDNIWTTILSYTMGISELQDTNYQDRPRDVTEGFRLRYRQQF